MEKNRVILLKIQLIVKSKQKYHYFQIHQNNFILLENIKCCESKSCIRME